MAFENIGRDCDREMEKLAQELLKMEKEFAQQLFRGMTKLYNSWKEHRDDNRLREELEKNQSLKMELEAMKINLKKMFNEFQQTGFDPNHPQQDPTQEHSNEHNGFDVEQTSGEFNEQSFSDVDFNPQAINLDDIDMSEIGDTFSVGGLDEAAEFEQMSIFDAFDLETPEVNGPDFNMGEALENIDFDIPDLEL